MRILACAVAAFALAACAASLDAHAVAAAVGAAGPAALLALVPFGAQVVVEAASWRRLLRRLRRAVPWREALRATLLAEAVRLSFPGGAAVADSLRPALFARRVAMPLRDGLASLAVRKLCHLGTQGIYLGLGAALGATLLDRAAVSAPAAVRGALRVATVLTPAALVAAALTLGLVAFRGGLAARAQRLASQATCGRVGAALDRWRAGSAAVDGRVRLLLGRSGGTLAWNLTTALLGWLLEAAETLVLLTVLGAPLGAGDALAVEACASVLRVAAVVVPGGIGVQDLGYAALLAGSISEPAAVAFVVLKRAKELFWIVCGFLLGRG